MGGGDRGMMGRATGMGDSCGIEAMGGSRGLWAPLTPPLRADEVIVRASLNLKLYLGLRGGR